MVSVLTREEVAAVVQMIVRVSAVTGEPSSCYRMGNRSRSSGVLASIISDSLL